MPLKTDLSKYDNSWYEPGSFVKRTIWYFINAIFLNSSLFPSSSLKRFLLKLFGARIGKGVIIKPNVNIKFPWKLKIGNHTWIGEGVWIDNLSDVIIGNNVCLSQKSFLLCGSHNYKTSSFDLLVKNIVIEDGVWIGAEAIVSQGVICKNHSVLSLKSVAKGVLEPYSIYEGNPAKFLRKRIIEE